MKRTSAMYPAESEEERAARLAIPEIHKRAWITEDWIEHCHKQLAAYPNEQSIWESAIKSATEWLDWYKGQYPERPSRPAFY